MNSRWQAWLVLGLVVGLFAGIFFSFGEAATQSAILGYKVVGLGTLTVANPADGDPTATITITQKQGRKTKTIGQYANNPYNSGLLKPGVYTITSSQPEGNEVSYVISNNSNPWDPNAYTQGTSLTVDTRDKTKYPDGNVHVWWRYLSPPSGVTSIDQTSQWTKGEVLLKNFMNMYNANVLYDPTDTSFPYKMWFFGWRTTVCNPPYSGCDAIFFARSSDGNQWQVYSGKASSGSPKFDTTMTPSSWVPVITAQNKYYDQWHNGDPSVVKVGSIYYIAYSATGFDKDGIATGQPGDTDGEFNDIMGAVSMDGITWQKRSSPLLAAPTEYGSTDIGQNMMYHRPSLMYENGKFRLWFDHWDTVHGLSMGYAELNMPNPSSSAFLSAVWSPMYTGSKSLIYQFPNPSVIHVGDTYYAYADPPQFYDPTTQDEWQARKITEAVSSDGINWEVTGYIDPETGCAADHVPELYYTGDGKIYLTYGCQKGGNPYDYTYKEIRRMWKQLPL